MTFMSRIKKESRVGRAVVQRFYFSVSKVATEGAPSLEETKTTNRSRQLSNRQVSVTVLRIKRLFMRKHLELRIREDLKLKRLEFWELV